MHEHEVRVLTPRDALDVWEVLRDDGGYCRRVEGREPTYQHAENLFTERPPGVDASHKHVVGMMQGGRLIAVADVVEGWPDEGIHYIGLLQVKGSHQGRGLASKLHTQLLGLFPANRWRLSVVDTNALVTPFWQSLGYQPTGEERPWLNAAAQQHTAVIFERRGS